MHISTNDIVSVLRWYLLVCVCVWVCVCVCVSLFGYVCVFGGVCVPLSSAFPDDMKEHLRLF